LKVSYPNARPPVLVEFRPIDDKNHLAETGMAGMLNVRLRRGKLMLSRRLRAHELIRPNSDEKARAMTEPERSSATVFDPTPIGQRARVTAGEAISPRFRRHSRQRRTVEGLTLRIAASLMCFTFLAGPASAQVSPDPDGGDPHLQTIQYDPNKVVRVQVAVGYQASIDFGTSEEVENLAIGDSSAWQVAANKRGDYVFVKPIQSGLSTNMTVITSSRTYRFELLPLDSATRDMAYVIRFQYPALPLAPSASPKVEPGHYLMSGDKALRPSEIDDDGVHTYVSWARDQPLPAIFVIGSNGLETLVNGAMRDDSFVIDSVSPKLIFRIDKHVATATRIRRGVEAR
jgi:type IV secretion system protein VirB9